MNRQSTYNFSAGPSVMPNSALEKAAGELMNYSELGISVLEMSHRSPAFADIFSSTKEKLRNVLNIPETHEILFLQGGATLQFASIPMNLIGITGKADYAVTGNFATIASKEAEKYGKVHISASSEDKNHSYIPTQEELNIEKDSSYFYYCSNNTIFGTEWQYMPDSNGVKMVCDMSSDILTNPVDFSKYSLVYAGAQKNMAPAGLTVVIVDKSVLGNALPITPQVMDYKTLVEKDSMLNTPPCWCIYMLGLTLDWVVEQGGIPAMQELKKERAGLIYDVLDNSKLFIPHARPDSRSYMNVTFRTESAELDKEFIDGAAKLGLLSLKGHRITGGMRASMYNAMPVEGARLLADYMKKFEVEHK